MNVIVIKLGALELAGRYANDSEPLPVNMAALTAAIIGGKAAS